MDYIDHHKIFKCFFNIYLQLFEQFTDLYLDNLLLFEISELRKQLQQEMLAFNQNITDLWQQELEKFKNELGSTDSACAIFDRLQNIIHYQYNLIKKHIYLLLKILHFRDKSLERRTHFFAKQLLDTFSPDFLYAINKELVYDCFKKNGEGFFIGVQNFLNDINSGSLQYMTSIKDIDSFKVGENIAITPGKVIYQNHLMELIQYNSKTLNVKNVPLLIIPPWINKYYILDLSPHNSLIRWLVAKGITVFVISWVNPKSSHAHIGMEDYLNDGAIAATHIIQAQLKIKHMNVVGYCIGGTLLSMLLAYNNSKNITNIRSATFFNTLIDFSEAGDLSIFIDEHYIAHLEKQMNEKGYLDGKLLNVVFKSLRARDLIWIVNIRNYLLGKRMVFTDIQYWDSDFTNMPAKMHSQYLRWMYLNNDLIKTNKICIDGTSLNVNDIDIPTFFISSQNDNLAPWKTTYIGYQLMKGEKFFLLTDSGHIRGIINPPECNAKGYYINTSAEKKPEQWLENAEYIKGSWWPSWLLWLEGKSGENIKAPQVSKLTYKKIIDAPGSYVHQIN